MTHNHYLKEEDVFMGVLNATNRQVGKSEFLLNLLHDHSDAIMVQPNIGTVKLMEVRYRKMFGKASKLRIIIPSQIGSKRGTNALWLCDECFYYMDEIPHLDVERVYAIGTMFKPMMIANPDSSRELHERNAWRVNIIGIHWVAFDGN